MNFMKNRKRLDCVKEAESLLPGVAVHLQPYKGDTAGRLWEYRPTSLMYGETGEFQIVAARWYGHDYTPEKGHMGWLSVHYRGTDGELKHHSTERITDTRWEREHLRKYRGDMQDFKHVDIWHPDGRDNRIKVSWVNDRGVRGPEYDVELK